MLIDSFYALFGIIMQIPATFIIEYLGRKKSIIFANIINCMYMLAVMFSQNLFNLIIAEILSSLAFAIKETADPALLNESIPPSKEKGKIFAKINQKGISNYYVINAISTILAGIFYDINPYIPISLALSINILVTMISMGFIEPQRQNKKVKMQNFNQIKELKEAMKFILKSERLKALILFSAVTIGIISVLTNYEISLLENFDIPATYLCMIFAILEIFSGLFTKRQEKFHEKFRNRSLCTLVGIMGISILLAGIFGILAKENRIFIIFIVITYLIRYAYRGMYYPLIEKYLRNFANDKIDTKIFTAKNTLGSILSAIIGIFASFLLERMDIMYCITIIGILTIIFTIAMQKYMKTRVGLKPEEYSKEELKYDEID